jgi:Asp-tRNA(Asn)/Glu-tRNA(Gln) amidotransferase A subunit family amidase
VSFPRPSCSPPCWPGSTRSTRRSTLLRTHREQIKATLAWNIEKGVALTGEQIAAARVGQAEIFQRVKSFLADGPYDVLALPTVQVVPFPVEQEWVAEINGEPMATYIDWMRSCSRITVSAHPAVSVPAGLTAAGLPVGLQLVGRYGADRRLLEIAAAIMEPAGSALPGQGLTRPGRTRPGFIRPGRGRPGCCRARTRRAAPRPAWPSRRSAGARCP